VLLLTELSPDEKSRELSLWPWETLAAANIKANAPVCSQRNANDDMPERGN